MIDGKISYVFNNDYILRTYNDQIDTFSFKINKIEMDEVQVNDESLVNYLELIINNEQQEQSFTMYKNYGAIVQIEKENGDRY